MGVVSLKDILLISFFLFASLANSLPLSTNGRWVVDSMTGKRVKLQCINWASHMQSMVVEGLDKKPLPEIVDSMSSLGFNCVRLTYATYMFTRLDYGTRTVDHSFTSLNLTEARDGIAKNNPSLLNLTVVEAYHKVVDELGAKGIMVVLDNHISRPNWCCSENDGNGFFGDEYFDAEEWLEGLTIVARRFKYYPQVVAMSMRNELRGPRQAQPDWFRWVGRGGRRIHFVNPKLLVIVSGLSYDTDLSFLPRNLSVNLGNKLVYEGHWYAFSSGRRKAWVNGPLDKVCATTMKEFDDRIYFVTKGKNPVPLFASDFGVDQRGLNQGDNMFISCFLAYAAERDLDWALWALQGSYYIRENKTDFEETYGVLDKNWDQPRNPKFRERYRLVE
ncbi:Glycoside hydrolase [Macleaya cordata]|uniref:Glycoside hydrolase n=1 Tax=Macleaya cordata TaxID=56857 RepID=A0A200R894_MACCD|nr:Glycoside hydrolase [Macleaya cordata]